MKALNFIYDVLNTSMEVPKSYGAYHISSVVITLILAVLMVAFLKNTKDKTVRAITAVIWIVVVFFEITKQLLYGIHMNESGTFYWDYNWYFFPFQFCSSPLYILPIVAFARNGKLRDAAIAFLATFSVFAGICVYVFPNDVFTNFTFINIQTMIHHGVQIFFGAYLAFRYRDKLNLRGLVGATGIFTALAAIALILNIGTHHIFPLVGINESINMFFISPYHSCSLPVLSMVDEALPYLPFLCVYIFGFMLCAGLIMLIMKGLIKITRYSK